MITRNWIRLAYYHPAPDKGAITALNSNIDDLCLHPACDASFLPVPLGGLR